MGGIASVPKEGGVNSHECVCVGGSHRAPHPAQKYERHKGERPPPGPEEGEDEVVVSVLGTPQQDGDDVGVDIGSEPEGRGLGGGGGGRCSHQSAQLVWMASPSSSHSVTLCLGRPSPLPP